MQNCMKLSGTIEMTVVEFFVNLTFEHQREGLFLFSIIDIINYIYTQSVILVFQAIVLVCYLWLNKL